MNDKRRRQTGRIVPQMTEMPMGRLPEWVIGDTHFGHDNIIRYSHRPVDHDALMVANWKRIVKPNEIVLHLGDVYFKNPELVARAKLPGQIYVLRGNHDKDRALGELREMGWKLIAPFQYQMGKWRFVFTHWPLEALGANVINVHGHTHTLPDRSARHLSLCVERWDYRPQPLLELLKDRIAMLDDPERKAEYEKARVAEWDLVEKTRGEREARLEL